MRTTLLVTVFLAGGSLMSLEMASFRLVQPEFGSDIVVWGSLISVFLGGLAVGAIVGGRMADRGPTLGKLGAILLISGAVTLALPLYAGAVLDWMYPGEGAPLPAEWDADKRADAPENPGALPGPSQGGVGDGQLAVYQPPDLRWPTLWAGTLLFGIPAILLGMVSPYAARLFVHAMPQMGAGVGEVYGVSTIGSIAGTIGTAFYLIAWMGTKWLLSANGLLLVGLGLVLALMSRAAAMKPAAD